ncbi:hypothetical protein E2C01_073025 [Portunus trituberculatus]|uniref:Uncharacterized protein n=1 Tax=Portunus trituberculatus TaxID=210409 RepID=A0A5B7IAK0_PORTR|nr:hypothetical protein [Portunus trituberculatus]
MRLVVEAAEKYEGSDRCVEHERELLFAKPCQASDIEYLLPHLGSLYAQVGITRVSHSLPRLSAALMAQGTLHDEPL